MCDTMYSPCILILHFHDLVLYSVQQVDCLQDTGCKYDFISCLNVLDRCSHPLSMLNEITSCLQPGAVIVVVEIVIIYTSKINPLP